MLTDLVRRGLPHIEFELVEKHSLSLGRSLGERVRQTDMKANKAEYRELAPDGKLFCVDPESFLKRKRSGRRKKKTPSGSQQLLLFGDL